MTEVLTALSTTVGADVRHKRLEHPMKQVIRGLPNILEPGMNVEGPLSPCEPCNQ